MYLGTGKTKVIKDNRLSDGKTVLGKRSSCIGPGESREQDSSASCPTTSVSNGNQVTFPLPFVQMGGLDTMFQNIFLALKFQDLSRLLGLSPFTSESGEFE